MMPKIIVALVNWNTKELTHNCLESLIDELYGLSYEIWIVDNSSSDCSAEMIKTKFPNVKLIENSDNVGFARANNQILRKAAGDYYLLLNTDTIIPPGAIRELMAFMDKNPYASLAAPRLIYPDGSPQPPLRALPSLWGEFRYCLVYYFYPFSRFLGPILKERPLNTGKINQPLPKTILSAACLIIRKSVFEQIGFLGEEYFLFSEENDYFTRLKQADLKSYYLPFIDVIHLIGKSREKDNSYNSETNFLKSRMLYFKKFHADKVWIIKLTYYLFLSWSYFISTLSKILKRRKESYYQVLYRKLIYTLHNG